MRLIALLLIVLVVVVVVVVVAYLPHFRLIVRKNCLVVTTIGNFAIPAKGALPNGPEIRLWFADVDLHCSRLDT